MVQHMGELKYEMTQKKKIISFVQNLTEQMECESTFLKIFLTHLWDSLGCF